MKLQLGLRPPAYSRGRDSSLGVPTPRPRSPSSLPENCPSAGRPLEEKPWADVQGKLYPGFPTRVGPRTDTHELRPHPPHNSLPLFPQAVCRPGSLAHGHRQGRPFWWGMCGGGRPGPKPAWLTGSWAVGTAVSSHFLPLGRCSRDSSQQPAEPACSAGHLSSVSVGFALHPRLCWGMTQRGSAHGAPCLPGPHSPPRGSPGLGLCM